MWPKGPARTVHSILQAGALFAEKVEQGVIAVPHLGCGKLQDKAAQGYGGAQALGMQHYSAGKLQCWVKVSPYLTSAKLI